jgi:hypothetical protein
MLLRNAATPQWLHVSSVFRISLTNCARKLAKSRSSSSRPDPSGSLRADASSFTPFRRAVDIAADGVVSIERDSIPHFVSRWSFGAACRTVVISRAMRFTRRMFSAKRPARVRLRNLNTNFRRRPSTAPCICFSYRRSMFRRTSACALWISSSPAGRSSEFPRLNRWTSSSSAVRSLRADVAAFDGRNNAHLLDHPCRALPNEKLFYHYLNTWR